MNHQISIYERKQFSLQVNSNKKVFRHEEKLLRKHIREHILYLPM